MQLSVPCFPLCISEFSAVYLEIIPLLCQIILKFLSKLFQHFIEIILLFAVTAALVYAHCSLVVKALTIDLTVVGLSSSCGQFLVLFFAFYSFSFNVQT